MTRWFRFYDDAVNDPKLLRLPDDLYRAWTILLCFASKGGGVLPPADDIALALRMKTAKVAEWITKLVRAGLIDNIDGHFEPHNWNGRQYKSDVSTERVKRFRNGKRNVSETASETAPEQTQIQNTEQIDNISEGRGRSVFTEASNALADAFLQALGFDTPLKVPPEFSGVHWRAVTWDAAGYTSDMIAADAKKTGPDKPISYHEKVFATTFAKLQAPLPVVEIREAETLKVTHGRVQKTESLSAVARRHSETGIAFGERPSTPSLRSIEGGADVRLLPQSGGERSGDLCGGDGGGIERIPARRD